MHVLSTDSAASDDQLRSDERHRILLVHHGAGRGLQVSDRSTLLMHECLSFV